MITHNKYVYAKYWPIYLTLNELNIIGTGLKNPASVSQIKCHKKGRIILNRIKSIEMDVIMQ